MLTDDAARAHDTFLAGFRGAFDRAQLLALAEACERDDPRRQAVRASHRGSRSGEWLVFQQVRAV